MRTLSNTDSIFSAIGTINEKIATCRESARVGDSLVQIRLRSSQPETFVPIVAETIPESSLPRLRPTEFTCVYHGRQGNVDAYSGTTNNQQSAHRIAGNLASSNRVYCLLNFPLGPGGILPADTAPPSRELLGALTGETPGIQSCYCFEWNSENSRLSNLLEETWNRKRVAWVVPSGSIKEVVSAGLRYWLDLPNTVKKLENLATEDLNSMIGKAKMLVLPKADSNTSCCSILTNTEFVNHWRQLGLDRPPVRIARP